LNTLFFLPRMIRPLPWQKFPLLARYLLSPGWNFGSWLSSPHTAVLASINMSFRWQVRESIKIVKRASVQFIEEAGHSIGNQSIILISIAIQPIPVYTFFSQSVLESFHHASFSPPPTQPPSFLSPSQCLRCFLPGAGRS